MNKTIAAAVLSIMTVSAGVSFAQDANGNNPAMSPKARLERQHDRIQEGVKDGTIDKKEHRKLARQGRAINRQRKRDLKKDGGTLDKKDRKQLEKEENHRSKEIYNDKH